MPSKKDLGVTESCRQLTLLFMLYLELFFFPVFYLRNCQVSPVKVLLIKLHIYFSKTQVIPEEVGVFFCLFAWAFFVLFSKIMLLILGVEVMFIL